MTGHQDPHPKKKVSAATSDAPQEEFISQKSVPSEPEKDSGKKDDRDPEKSPCD